MLADVLGDFEDEVALLVIDGGIGNAKGGENLGQFAFKGNVDDRPDDLKDLAVADSCL